MAKKTANFSPAYQAFVASMRITMDQWRDGVGYNVEALKSVTGAERVRLVDLLREHLESSPDWRDVEALGAIGTKKAIKVLRGALEHVDSETRMYLERQLAEMGEPANIEDAIIEALRGTSMCTGFSQAIDMAEEHPTPRIQETLLDLALNGGEEQRIHCAALALYLGGKAEEAFDWNHRPFFLRFSDDDRSVQIKAYKELCRRLGVAPKV